MKPTMIENAINCFLASKAYRININEPTQTAENSRKPRIWIYISSIIQIQLIQYLNMPFEIT